MTKKELINALTGLNCDDSAEVMFSSTVADCESDVNIVELSKYFDNIIVTLTS